MPRVIAGQAGSVPLFSPDRRLTRPTSDKAKGALFSILSGRMPVSGFLDLYAGSGQIGLEAASRGCQDIVLVEKAAAAVRCIQQNLTKTGLTETCNVIQSSCASACRRLVREERQFSIIFMDPPYQIARREVETLAPLITRLLRPDGLLIVEQNSSDESLPFVMNLQRSRRCQYGAAMLSFYQAETA